MNQRPPIHRFVIALTLLLIFAAVTHAAPTSQPSSASGKTYPNGLSLAGRTDFTLSNVTISGGSLELDGVQRADIGTLTVIAPGYVTWGINAGISLVHIHHSNWLPPANGSVAPQTGIQAWGCNGIFIDHCTATRWTEWCHLFGLQNLPPGSASYGDIENCTITGGSRNDIEIQQEWQSPDGKTPGFELAYTSVTGRQPNLNGAGMTASIATGGTATQDTHGVYVHDNVFSLRGVSAGNKSNTLPLEIMGNGNRVDHNFLDCGNYPTVYTQTNMTRSAPGTPWSWTNNQVNDCNISTIGSEDDGLDGNKSLVPTIMGPTDTHGNVVTRGAPIPTVAQWANVAVDPVVTQPVVTIAPPTTAPAVNSVVATVLSNTSVELDWTKAIVNPTITVKATHGNPYPPVVYSDGGSRYRAVIVGLTPSWQFDFTVSGNNTTSNTVTALTSGTPAANPVVKPLGVVSSSTKSVTVTKYTDGSTVSQ